MDKQMRRKIIEAVYRVYRDRTQGIEGTDFYSLSEDEVSNTSDADLIVLTRHLRDVARPPAS